MSQERKNIINNFCMRFLELQNPPNSFSDILNLEPVHLKDCSPKENYQLQKGKITKIRHLAKIDFKKIDKKAEKLEVDPHQLRKWVLASQLVSRAWKKRNSYLKKDEMKVAVLGLDNAGKTSMLKILSEKTQIGNVVNIEPTIGISVQNFNSDNFNLLIWDFGGQIGHRHDYLQSPEDYFLQIDLLIYVIDMQDEDRFSISLDYFKQITEILAYLNEKPFFLIFQHKSDPDLTTEPDFLINLEYIRGEVSQILNELNFVYEIEETSIYNTYSKEPDLSKTFKNFFANRDETKSIDEYIKDISNTLVNLSATMLEQFRQIKSLIGSNNQVGTQKDYVKDILDVEFKKSIQESLSSIPTHAPPLSEQNKNGDLSKNSQEQYIQDRRLGLLNDLKEVLKARRILED